MLISFNPKIVERDKEEIFKYIQGNYWSTLIQRIINSKYKKSVFLQQWINNQLSNASDKLKSIASEIDTVKDSDEQVYRVLLYVRAHLTYTGDSNTWLMPEYWQTAEETITTWRGDCEDGAILTYILARLKGVPANRLLILCGDVKGGGHCWLAYKPTRWPLNYVFLDWCYWFDSNPLDERNKFYITETNKIIEYINESTTRASNYYTVWFGFNEDVGITKFKYNFDV